LALAGDPRKRLGLLDYFPITQIPHLIDYVRLEKVLPRVGYGRTRTNAPPLSSKFKIWFEPSESALSVPSPTPSPSKHI